MQLHLTIWIIFILIQKCLALFSLLLQKPQIITIFDYYLINNVTKYVKCINIGLLLENIY